MSTVDHKAEAFLALKMSARDVSANYEQQTGEKKSDVIALGQLHAILYAAEQTAALVKQQRVANLIAVVDAKYANGSGAFAALSDAAATEVLRAIGSDLGVEPYQVRTS